MAKKRIPRERMPALQKSYDQLSMWLNFDHDTKHGARQMLDGVYVKPFFDEYRRDYLEAADGIEDIDCHALFQLCLQKHAFAKRNEYSAARPDKKRWTALDHAARFLVCLLQFSWKHGGEWSHGTIDPAHDEHGEGDNEFAQVWAILRYLQAEWEAANLDGWDDDHLNDAFAELMSSRL
ncbi:Uu.00g054840.m01.CDS01 [Anthostomella pinea]|uniref:Uu.00g054840.m01.CDS01 n=1 Tax=Anthostomella pinea TaxID=933095 RepID=A0AAI8YPJ5_9PEZI|nr:Uu.00g054840.m01.CDS01 [Anthostomella pinea]